MSELLKGAFSGPKIDLLTKQIDFKSPIITSQKVEDEEEKSKLQADKIDSPPLTAFQLKEKNEKTLFIGNLDMSTKISHLKSLFKKYGKIESIRFRSIPTEDSNLPKRASVILKHVDTSKKGSKNAYIVFENKAEAESALELNGTMVKDKRMRVDMAASNVHKDVKNTIFIGNLPFHATEEQVQIFFAECGDIDYVRIVRDSQTFIGKGIAYVKFMSKEGLKLGLDKNGVEFMNRELRIKKASTKQKLEKKELSRVKIRDLKREEKIQAKYNRLKLQKGAENAEVAKLGEKLVKIHSEREEPDIMSIKNQVKLSRKKTKRMMQDLMKKNQSGMITKMEKLFEPGLTKNSLQNKRKRKREENTKRGKALKDLKKNIKIKKLE